MSPKFIAYMVTMAINEGMDIARFMSELKANVTDEQWAELEADLRATNKAWESATQDPKA